MNINITPEELADKYIELARENVNVKKIYPPNRYTFTTKYFRPLKGWDTAWYDMMYYWTNILKEKGWKEDWYNKEDLGGWNILNFQYLYDSELPSGSLDFTMEEIKQMVDIKELTPEKCNQISLSKEDFYKLPR